MPTTEDLPLEAYDGREQALVKHKLLEGYLEKLVLIIGASAKRSEKLVEINYVDCFAGPWGAPEDSMDSTSIAISLRTLAECQAQLDKLGVKTRIRALYVEEKAKSFARLDAYLRQSTPSSITAEALKGDFVQLRESILRWCGDSPFTFFFIDPLGWTEIGISVLRPLLRRPRSEFLINFMYAFVNRAASMADQQERMADLLGESVDLEGLSPAMREAVILSTYRHNLKATRKNAAGNLKARAAYVRVMEPLKERVKYHLVYLTSHPRGVIEFMKISEQTDIVQARVRQRAQGKKRSASTGMDDLFSDQEPVDTTVADPAQVDQYWLEYLASGPRTIGYGEFADILEETDWFPRDLQASLVDLIGSGRVVNRNAQRARPKSPLHYEDSDILALP
jgi:three-Cys-motif partner protein